MKNIFHQSFNAYKTDIEPRLSDVTLHHMQCSRRLFEIQLSHRRISAAYIEGDNVAVTVEGEAARVLNFDTGIIIALVRLRKCVWLKQSNMCYLFINNTAKGETTCQSSQLIIQLEEMRRRRYNKNINDFLCFQNVY